MVSPLTSHVTMEGPGCTGGWVRGEHQVHKQRTATVRALSRGDRDRAATKLCLNNRARSRRQANSGGDSGWAATAIRLQGQAMNYP